MRTEKIKVSQNCLEVVSMIRPNLKDFYDGHGYLYIVTTDSSMFIHDGDPNHARLLVNSDFLKMCTIIEQEQIKLE